MIFEIYIWVLSFISVFLAVLWILVNHVSKHYEIEDSKLSIYPTVTVAIPVHNEKDSIIPTLKAILNQDYPKDKLQIIIVDDHSRDGTGKIASKFISKLKFINIKLITHTKNLGKAGAMNTALKIAKGDYFWVYDADSIASRNLLKSMILKFNQSEDPKVAAVVAITLIKNQGKIIEKMQRLEYVMAAFTRKLLGNVDTLHTTNALSLFKTKVIKKIGGFDQGNLTEDFEIAMRLRYNGYRIVMCEKGSFHTTVPSTLKKMWMQRVRWFRGFIYNNLKYKKMIMNKEYGLLGLFQIPIELFFLIAVFVSIALFSYNIFIFIVNLFYRIYLLRWEIFSLDYISIKSIILGLNWKLFFPSLIVLFLGLYLYISAHRYVREKWKFYIPSIFYIFIYPVFRSLQWLHAFVLEFGRAERKW
jgi:cellulose synthase/poly-beta-1,6-N-acetylglucosamine synthase-like glycosyltransferase